VIEEEELKKILSDGIEEKTDATRVN